MSNSPIQVFVLPKPNQTFNRNVEIVIDTQTTVSWMKTLHMTHSAAEACWHLRTCFLIEGAFLLKALWAFWRKAVCQKAFNANLSHVPATALLTIFPACTSRHSPEICAVTCCRCSKHSTHLWALGIIVTPHLLLRRSCCCPYGEWWVQSQILMLYIFYCFIRTHSVWDGWLNLVF